MGILLRHATCYMANNERNSESNIPDSIILLPGQPNPAIRNSIVRASGPMRHCRWQPARALAPGFLFTTAIAGLAAATLVSAFATDGTQKVFDTTISEFSMRCF